MLLFSLVVLILGSFLLLCGLLVRLESTSYEDVFVERRHSDIVRLPLRTSHLSDATLITLAVYFESDSRFNLY